MTVTIETIGSVFGEAYIVTATHDKYHRTIVKEFFSYTDAQIFANELFKRPLEPDYMKLFVRKGL